MALDVPFVVFVPAPDLAAEVWALGIFARRNTSVINSGNVSHLPLRRSSRDSARTLSDHPVRARESARTEERSDIWPVERRCAIKAWEVAGGRLALVDVRLVGVGIEICGCEDDMALARGGFVG